MLSLLARMPSSFAILVLAALPVLAEQGSVKGRLMLPDGVTLPPQASVHVMLLDVSSGNASSLVLAEKKFAVPDAAPIPFVLSYDKAKIDQKHDYAIAARITVDGRPRLISDKKAVVITKGRPTDVAVILKPVGRTAAPPAN